MALVGYAPNRSVEIATVVRFGQIVYMVAKIYRLHQIPLPKGHQELMNKAVRALQKVSEDKNAKIIQQNYSISKNNPEAEVPLFISLFPKMGLNISA